jgi:hypothetical protein
MYGSSLVRPRLVPELFGLASGWSDSQVTPLVAAPEVAKARFVLHEVEV